MVKKKGASKRQTFKQKYKIDRKVKDHKRKVKKETRRRAKLGLPPKGIGQRKRANTIPNAWPFKAQLLEEIAEAKRKAEEEKLRQKEEAALRRRQGLIGTDVEQLVKQAQERADNFQASAAQAEQDDELVNDTNTQNLGAQSRRAYIRDLQKVIETADVILEVLDARDPLGSRALAVEDLVLSKGNKKLILVMNKVDLVPREIIPAWLTYLQRSHPAIAFKAAMQEQRQALHQQSGDAAKVKEHVLSRSGSVGTEALMGLLKNYCRNRDIKTSITVGIIGYPNVGKSSIINSLKRGKSVGVSSTPGFTKAMQEVQLDRHIKLLDSPGIIFDDSDSEGILLRNCVNVDTLADPLQAVSGLLKRCDPNEVMMIYALPRFDPTDIPAFLALLAKKTGKLLKGGLPDRNAAARLLLRDWNLGKVPFHTKPPEDEEKGRNVLAEEAQLLPQMQEAFDVMKEGGAQLLGHLDEAGDVESVEGSRDRVGSLDFPKGNDGMVSIAAENMEMELQEQQPQEGFQAQMTDEGSLQEHHQMRLANRSGRARSRMQKGAPMRQQSALSLSIGKRKVLAEVPEVEMAMSDQEDDFSGKTNKGVSRKRQHASRRKAAKQARRGTAARRADGEMQEL